MGKSVLYVDRRLTGVECFRVAVRLQTFMHRIRKMERDLHDLHSQIPEPMRTALRGSTIHATYKTEDK